MIVLGVNADEAAYELCQGPCDAIRSHLGRSERSLEELRVVGLGPHQALEPGKRQAHLHRILEGHQHLLL